MSTEWITLTTDDGPMRVYVARPQEPGNRAVLVLQEAFGVNENIQNTARRFAGRGFLALAPDLFHRTGPAVLPYTDHEQAVGLISQLGPEQILPDVEAVLAHVADAEDIERASTAIVGFCFGGRAAFTAATAVHGLGAVVVFYGPGIAAGPHATLDRSGSIDAPLLMHVGAEDPTIPGEHVAAIDAALNRSDGVFTHHVYPDAGHAFACEARPHMYRQEPADLAWARTEDFLDQHLPAAV